MYSCDYCSQAATIRQRDHIEETNYEVCADCEACDIEVIERFINGVWVEVQHE